MNIYLFNVNKRPNSTYQPPLSQGTEIIAQLKDEVSFENPVFKIKPDIIVGTFTPVAFNFAYVPYWQRYYFISDWKYLNGCWECYCSVDVLASFKSQIGNTTAYITRASGQYDGSIIDTMYPAKTNVQISKIPVATSWNGIFPSSGTYVVGCINNQSSGRIGAITYYALTSAELGNLLAYLFSDNIFNASSITEIGEGLFKSMFDPFQYIVSCLWFPWDSGFGSTQAYIRIGYWTTTVQGIVVTSLFTKTYVTATLPNHPQISRGEYLNRAPYTKLTLYLPPFGAIPIDTNFMTIGNYLYCPVFCDHITGMATIRPNITRSSTYLDEFNAMSEFTGQMGVPIQLSQVMTDYIGTAHSVASTIGNALTGNLSGVLSGMLSAVETQMPKVSTSGANGSFMECLITPTIIAEHFLLTDEDNPEFGRPLFKSVQIRTLSGYIQTAEDDHAFSGTLSENEEINKHLKDGFFFE